MRKGFWNIRSPKKKIQKIISRVVEKVEKPKKPYPLEQDETFGWPSDPLRRGRQKNFITDWR